MRCARAWRILLKAGLVGARGATAFGKTGRSLDLCASLWFGGNDAHSFQNHRPVRHRPVDKSEGLVNLGRLLSSLVHQSVFVDGLLLVERCAGWSGAGRPAVDPPAGYCAIMGVVFVPA